MLDFGLLGTPSAMPMDAAESLVNGKSNAALALDSFAWCYNMGFKKMFVTNA